LNQLAHLLSAIPTNGVQARIALVNIAPSRLTGMATDFMLRFFIIFSVLLIGLFTLEILQPAEKYVILPFTSLIADISVWIVQVFDDNVIANGNVIRDKVSGFGVRIERGCNGLILNLVRIISLYYLGQWNYTAFEWFHLYLWQALIILDALVVWLIWLRTLPNSRRRSGELEPEPEPT